MKPENKLFVDLIELLKQRVSLRCRDRNMPSIFRCRWKSINIVIYWQSALSEKQVCRISAAMR